MRRHDATSHYWIDAIAGSGKTRFVIEHISHLRGNILCLSFSRSTVKKMHSAMPHHLGASITLCTVHSLAATISPITCDARADQLAWDILWQQLTPTLKLHIGALEQQYPGWRAVVDSHNVAPCDSTAQHFAQLKSAIAQRITATRGVVSYDDLLRSATTLLSTQPMPNPPEHILIDEAQDLTDLQWQLISAVFNESVANYHNPTITVVGDPNQIIYSFQGSSIRVWHKWRAWWHSLDGNKRPEQSTQCYRCGRAVLDVVNQLFAPAHLAQHTARSWVTLHTNTTTVSECATQITQYIKHLVDTDGAAPEEVLILVKRRGVLSQAITEQCKANNISLSGVPSDLSKEVDTIHSFFLAATQPSDGTLFATLKILHNNTEMRQLIRARTGSVADVIAQHYPSTHALLHALQTNDTGKFLHTLKQQVPLDPSVIRMAASYCAETAGHIADFAEYCKTQRTTSVDITPGHARLLTIHAAKGLQAKYVILADTHEGPYRMLRNYYNESNTTDFADNRRELALAESKNLLYVALTRAERGVLLCGPGKISADSFADLVQGAMIRLGAQQSGEKLHWER